MDNIPQLTKCAVKIRETLDKEAIRGKNGQPIEHIELFGPPSTKSADSKSFVLCPGDAYDRSPCGTGTSAKMACMYEKGLLALGQTWRQESILGTIFEGCLEKKDGKIYPHIKGSAHIIGENTLIMDPLDPFCSGIDKGMYKGR
jgi:4-hydroxyproline epimerase